MPAANCMHDLRAAPRWSKTAVVVVLVVFGLVLVVAIFGLWAFSSDQDARRVTARDQARVDVHARLEQGVRDDISARFLGLLARLAKKDQGLESATGSRLLKMRRELRAMFEGDEHGPLLVSVFRIDPADAGGVVSWPGGRYHLLLGAGEVERRGAAQLRAHLEIADPSADDFGPAADARNVERTQGADVALLQWRELARDFGLVAYAADDGSADPDKRTPYGLGWTVEMLECAIDALTADPTSVSDEELYDVILRSLEIATLHRERGRLDASFVKYKRRHLERQLARLLEKIPEPRRDLPAWEVAQFRLFSEEAAARLRTGHLRGMTLKAEKRGDSPYADGGRYVDHDEKLRPYGIALGRRVVVALLDEQAVHERIRQMLAKSRPELEGLGSIAKVVSVDADPASASEPSAGSVPLVGRVRLPYRLDFWQIGDPTALADQRNDTVLFWAVIALAVAGLIVGGHVLVRLLTREVRLAQLKADFVSNLSHELKTPITSISLFTEMLEEGKLTDPEDQAEAFSVLGLESRRLQRIVHRMIDVARGEARRNPYDLLPGDLNRPVLEAATRLQRIVTEPGLDLAIDLHPEPLYVQLDRQAMDDAVTNLLSNAWKYKRGDRARVAVRTARRGRFAEIVVSDDGIGIPRKDRRKVFEMFYRSEQYLTHPVAGTGLGLALVRSVVAGHKGRVHLDVGEGGVGTTFRIRIPLDRKARAELSAEGVLHEPSPDDSLSPDGTEASPHGKVEAPAGSTHPSARSRASNPGAQS